MDVPIGPRTAQHARGLGQVRVRSENFCALGALETTSSVALSDCGYNPSRSEWHSAEIDHPWHSSRSASSTPSPPRPRSRQPETQWLHGANFFGRAPVAHSQRIRNALADREQSSSSTSAPPTPPSCSGGGDPPGLSPFGGRPSLRPAVSPVDAARCRQCHCPRPLAQPPTLPTSPNVRWVPSHPEPASSSSSSNVSALTASGSDCSRFTSITDRIPEALKPFCKDLKRLVSMKKKRAARKEKERAVQHVRKPTDGGYGACFFDPHSPFYAGVAPHPTNKGPPLVASAGQQSQRLTGDSHQHHSDRNASTHQLPLSDDEICFRQRLQLLEDFAAAAERPGFLLASQSVPLAASTSPATADREEETSYDAMPVQLPIFPDYLSACIQRSAMQTPQGGATHEGIVPRAPSSGIPWLFRGTEASVSGPHTYGGKRLPSPATAIASLGGREFEGLSRSRTVNLHPGEYATSGLSPLAAEAPAYVASRRGESNARQESGVRPLSVSLITANTVAQGLRSPSMRREELRLSHRAVRTHYQRVAEQRGVLSSPAIDLK